MQYSAGSTPVGHRKHADVHFAELAASARLLLVAIAAFGRGLNRFAIGNLGLLGVDLDLVAAFEPLANHLQVQLAHAVHHQLVRLRVAVQLNGAVLFDDLVAARRTACLRRRGSWA